MDYRAPPAHSAAAVDPPSDGRALMLAACSGPWPGTPMWYLGCGPGPCLSEATGTEEDGQHAQQTEGGAQHVPPVGLEATEGPTPHPVAGSLLTALSLVPRAAENQGTSNPPANAGLRAGSFGFLGGPIPRSWRAAPVRQRVVRPARYPANLQCGRCSAWSVSDAVHQSGEGFDRRVRSRHDTGRRTARASWPPPLALSQSRAAGTL